MESIRDFLKLSGGIEQKVKLKTDFPNLFREIRWQTVTCRFELLDEVPPAHLISNVNLVPFKGNRWLIPRWQTGEWKIPGGTLEPGENYLDAMRRELLEEASARLITFEPLGAWHCFSTASEPYRPHLPPSRVLSDCRLWRGRNRWQP